MSSSKDAIRVHVDHVFLGTLPVEVDFISVDPERIIFKSLNIDLPGFMQRKFTVKLPIKDIVKSRFCPPSQLIQMPLIFLRVNGVMAKSIMGSLPIPADLKKLLHMNPMSVDVEERYIAFAIDEDITKRYQDMMTAVQWMKAATKDEASLPKIICNIDYIANLIKLDTEFIVKDWREHIKPPRGKLPHPGVGRKNVHDNNITPAIKTAAKPSLPSNPTKSGYNLRQGIRGGRESNGEVITLDSTPPPPLKQPRITSSSGESSNGGRQRHPAGQQQSPFQRMTRSSNTAIIPVGYGHQLQWYHNQPQNWYPRFYPISEPTHTPVQHGAAVPPPPPPPPCIGNPPHPSVKKITPPSVQLPPQPGPPWHSYKVGRNWHYQPRRQFESTADEWQLIHAMESKNGYIYT